MVCPFSWSAGIESAADISTKRFSSQEQVRLMKKHIAVIILAAGMGTRMKSDKAKVLHKVADRPMILYVVEAAREIAGDDTIVVVGHQAQKVQKIISETTRVIFAYQEKQFGTAHAVQCALPCVPDHCDHVVILCGDVPLILPQTINGLIETHLQCQYDISLLAVELENPYGYGRVLLNHSRQVTGIIEEADATPEQKQIKLINAGIYCVNKNFLQDALPRIGSNNAQQELYLTDIMAIGHGDKKKRGVMVVEDSLQILGVNNTRDLAEVDALMKKRIRNIS